MRPSLSERKERRQSRGRKKKKKRKRQCHIETKIRFPHKLEVESLIGTDYFIFMLLNCRTASCYLTQYVCLPHPSPPISNQELTKIDLSIVIWIFKAAPVPKHSDDFFRMALLSLPRKFLFPFLPRNQRRKKKKNPHQVKVSVTRFSS